MAFKNITLIVMLLDQSFGMLRLTQDNTLVGIDLLPGTAQIIEKSKELGIKVVLLVPKVLSDKSLENLMQFVPSIGNVVTYENDVKKDLLSWAKSNSKLSDSMLFVSSDRVLRGLAADMGYIAVPHPTIATFILQDKSYQFVRILGEQKQFENFRETIPYFTYRADNGLWNMLAIMTDGAINEVTRKFNVQKLPLKISIEDPIFVEMDIINNHAAEKLKKHKVILDDGRRMVIALGPTELNEALDIHEAHAHAHPQLLAPSPELLTPAFSKANDFGANKDLKRMPIEERKETLISENITPPTSDALQTIIDRYSGKSNLDNSGPIISRHIKHSDNVRVVQALKDELSSLGYCPFTHSFNFAGMTLNNVIADLPGSGYPSLEPNIQEKVRNLFLKYPNLSPVENLLPALTELAGERLSDTQFTNEATSLELRTSLEVAYGLRHWFPWWLESCPLPGPGAELIIVGCHLDSTAADNEGGYNPIIDPAPGADDDASGIAATLAIAKYLANFRGKLVHTVRFCFFNAEESGLVGSKAYAAMLKSTGAPVKAAICMDMIGFNSDENRFFEIHAGYSDTVIRDASIPIAQIIANHALEVNNQLDAQIYKGTSTTPNSDRNLFDGAINRSDHASFHQQGYPAVVVSEDFFMNLPSEPNPDPNPNYHKGSDKIVDMSYCSDITNVIADSVIELAER